MEAVSNVRWSLRSDRYHYKLQESAKMCAPVLKCHQLQGASPPDPPPGALPLEARWGLRPQTPVIGSRSRARHTSPLPLLQTTSDAPADSTPLFSTFASQIVRLYLQPLKSYKVSKLMMVKKYAKYNIFVAEGN